MTDGGGIVLAERHHLSGVYDSYAGLGEAASSLRTPQESSYPAMYPSDYDYPTRYVGSSQEKLQEKTVTSAGLTTRESVELFQEAVDAARDSYPKTLVGSEAAGDTPIPKLTVDLRHRGLSSIPKEVIAIIQQDVERLHLAHNLLRSIAYEFSNCSALKYLNMRDNRLKEIPKAIFGLPQMEILDLSRNKISEIPSDIESLKALRVFSIQHNSIEDLPNGLGSTSTLRMLKMAGNPWEPGIKRILSTGDTTKDDNERDTMLTPTIKEYLRARAVKDSGEDASSDEPIETPRAQTRFPIQPRTYGHYTSGSESASDLKSPRFPKSPPPNRSHFRVPSSQSNALQAAGLRRPGLSPLTLGNDRNRSNSESVLQATQSNKVKRMGMINKKNPGLGTLDETGPNRNSYHLRGQSHGSALRNGVRAGEGSPSSLASPNGGDWQRGTMVRRLSSLPEQKREDWPMDKTIEGARGVLYALHLINPHLATMASLLKDGTTKTPTIDRAFKSVTINIDKLDEELHRFDGILDQRSESGKQSKNSVTRATQSCILAHQQIGTILMKSVKQIVRGADPRYLRTLMLMLYGSLSEMSNASRSLGGAHSNVPIQKTNFQRISTITEVPNERERLSIRDHSVTPTQERLRTERRWRQGSVQHSSSYANLYAAHNPQSSIPLYPNGRSRSNSRVGALYSSASNSALSSMVSTPHSGETFSISARSRSGSVNVTPEQARLEKEQAAHFERIFDVLKQAADEGLQIVKELEPYFVHGLDTSNKKYDPERIRDLWLTLIANCKHCVNMSEVLKMRLSTVRLNDPDARNARDFWRLVNTFLDSYGNLLVSLKEGRRHNITPDDMRHWVRPVHQATREAARLIADSPWNRLTQELDPLITSQPQLQPPMSTLRENGWQQHRSKGSGGSTAGSGFSPLNASVPATPLSAALGPAAQATVPATPASASLEQTFQGNIFERADTLQKQQTMIYRR